MKRIFIKQKPGKVAQYFGLDTKDVSVYPNARQSYSPREDEDGKSWVTGLNENAIRVNRIKEPKKREEEKKRIKNLRTSLEESLGVDLGPHSDFWIDYRIQLIDNTGTEKRLDLDNPNDLLLYTVAVANYYLAPQYEDLYGPEYSQANAFLYVYNPQQESSRKVQLQELKDRVASLFNQYGRQKEQLFYWAHALKKGVNSAMTRDDLYGILSAHRETLKTIEQYEAFLDILQIDKEKLQLGYFVTMGIRKKQIIRQQGVYQFEGRELGVSETDVLTSLLDPRNADLVDRLMDTNLVPV